MSTILEQIGGGHRGQLYINGAVTGKSFHTLIVHADCVFTVLSDSAGVNLLADYALSGVTVKAGTLITTNGNPITNVTVSSGSVFGYTV
jgi:hypothetical protein